jgi:hypothetical protein
MQNGILTSGYLTRTGEMTKKGNLRAATKVLDGKTVFIQEFKADDCQGSHERS